MTMNLKRLVLVLCVLTLSISCFGVTAFAASDPLVAEIPVSLTLNGTLPAEAEVFTVRVTAVSAGAPMPAGADGNVFDMKLTGDAAVVSDVLSIDYNAAALGIYEYTVQQLAGSDPDCQYDTAVFNVKVYILNKDGVAGREMHIVITSGDEKPDAIGFVNCYADPVSVTVSALKYLNGAAPDKDLFLFQLLGENGKVLQEVRNDKENVVFPEFTYGEPEDLGTHVYTLKEVDENVVNITYDESVYTVTVDVANDGEGNYTAKVGYQLDGEEYEGTPTFQNKMKVPVGPPTGDNLMILFWGGLMVVSAVALVALFLAFKRKKEAEAAFGAAMEEADDSDLDA